MSHGFYYDNDGDGFVIGSCQCGWMSPPVPGVEDAADAYGDHRAVEGAATPEVITANLTPNGQSIVGGPAAAGSATPEEDNHG